MWNAGQGNYFCGKNFQLTMLLFKQRTTLPVCLVPLSSAGHVTPVGIVERGAIPGDGSCLFSSFFLQCIFIFFCFFGKVITIFSTFFIKGKRDKRVGLHMKTVIVTSSIRDNLPVFNATVLENTNEVYKKWILDEYYKYHI